MGLVVFQALKEGPETSGIQIALNQLGQYARQVNLAVRPELPGQLGPRQWEIVAAEQQGARAVGSCHQQFLHGSCVVLILQGSFRDSEALSNLSEFSLPMGPWQAVMPDSVLPPGVRITQDLPISNSPRGEIVALLEPLQKSLTGFMVELNS